MCEQYQIPVVDLAHESGISPYHAEQHDKYFVDGLHLNEAGHTIISYAIERAIDINHCMDI
nr:hypothetical protein [Eubacterium sp.]